MKRIVLILPYFGRVPSYFPLFLTSCRNNPTVDWLIYTDQPLTDTPANVKVIKVSFDSFARRIVDGLPFKATLKSPYKLCDFKPVYGEVLQDDISGYDFWGHCDCDLIFGDIRTFIGDDILERYTKVLSHGHLTLYHNDPETNSYYRRQQYKDPVTVLNDPRTLFFDEWHGVSRAWSEAGIPFCDDTDFDDIYIRRFEFLPVKWRADGTDRLISHVAYGYHNQRLYRYWEQDGKLQEEEILYVHFQKRRMEVETASTEEFMAVPNRFVSLPHELTLSELRHMTPYWSWSRWVFNCRREGKHWLYLQKLRVQHLMGREDV